MKKANKKNHLKICIVITLFLAVAILSAIFSYKVSINYNISDYLDDSTQTKIALNIIEDEFGMTGSIQVMAENVNVETADSIYETIKEIPNVLNVDFDKNDERYYKNNAALFNIVVDGDDYSENAKQVAEQLKQTLSIYEVQYGGTAIEKQSLQDAITGELVYILAIAICLVVAILLITSKSWIEPVILLAASGIAILINSGTNILFGSISYITNSIAAILQLALSIDYSIVLLHAYKKYKAEKSDTETNGDAMKKAVKSVVKPVSASSLTTIAGLVALLFMSFTIGFDIGIVLIKGIVISVVTSLTLLPSLLLLFDKPLEKTRKKAFAPKGKVFCKTSFKASKAIVPIALSLIIVCGALQPLSNYTFSDGQSGNTAIINAFGQNNTVVVVYENTKNNYDNEKLLTDTLSGYTKTDGNYVLTNYTAYSNTVREVYDIDKVRQKLDVSETDAELLFTMYNLYNEPNAIKLNAKEFIEYADYLLTDDNDAKEFADSDIRETINSIMCIEEVLSADNTAEQFYTKVTDGFSDVAIDLFSIKQLYGMYFYEETETSVDFETMLNFILSVSSNEYAADMFDTQTIEQLTQLSQGVAQFNRTMETYFTKTQLQAYFYQYYNVALSDEQATQIYSGYFASTEQPETETIPFLPLMKFLADSGQIADETAIIQIAEYNALYSAIHSEYDYEQFLPALITVAEALSGSTPQIAVDCRLIQQVYIMFFVETTDLFDDKTINGHTFVNFVNQAYELNDVIQNRLSDDDKQKLEDMLIVHEFLSDTNVYNYSDMTERLEDLQSNIKSDIATSSLEKDTVSGVFIKYSVNGDNNLLTPMMAYEILGFVSANMDENALLKHKLTEEMRDKINDAQNDLSKAEELFIGKNYSRLLLSLDLPNENEETTRFIEYLTDLTKEIFGERAYVTGEMISTYDLEQTFSRDNLLISIFTIVAIFIIIAIVFRSLSLPVILVSVIQGAIWISMAFQLIGSGVFFMSYIVATCILMGATIDYGILMSSAYVDNRQSLNKQDALYKSVETAMPTVFSSGLILTVCGFVVCLISSQKAISTVGLLIGTGTICSVVMITLVLPSVLYLLDKFVLKLSWRKKDKNERN